MKIFFKLSCFVLLSLCFSTSLEANKKIDPNTIAARLESSSSLFPIVIDRRVESYINAYVNRAPHATKILLERGSQFLPIVESYLSEMGLPQDLKYMTVVESGLKLDVSSHKGASGIWQLMPATARAFGLTVNRSLDERLDIHKSSRVALKYLAELYEDFGDWELTFAAYNAGPTKIKRYIKQAGGEKSIESIAHLLPKETTHYRAKYIAAKYIFENYAHHDVFFNQAADLNFAYLTSVQVLGPLNKSEMCRIYNLSSEEFTFYNPHILKENVVTNELVTINVPKYKSDEFKRKRIHIRSKDQLRYLARSLDVKMGYLLKWNHIQHIDQVMNLDQITIYVHPKMNGQLLASFYEVPQIPALELKAHIQKKQLLRPASVAENPYIAYTMKRFDSLAAIAQRHGLQVDELLLCNRDIAFREGAVIQIPK